MKRLTPPAGRPITIELDGDPLPAHEGEPLACALLAAGETVFARSVKYHRPRGAWCLAGECSHCLMRVDGVPNVFTCQAPARPGTRLERQNAYPSAKIDVFASIDWLFPHGLDHHEMFAGVPVAEKVMAKVARHLAGLGLLPESPSPERPAVELVETRVAIAGGGASGLAAAQALADAKLPFYLCEREEVLGGRWRSAALGGLTPPALEPPAGPGATVETSATAIGLYDDARGRYLAVVVRREGQLRLKLVHAERFLIAVGGHSALLPFGNNDLPGILSGAAASTLIRRRGLLPASDVALVGRGESLYALAQLLEKSGAKLTALVDLATQPPPGAPKIACHGTVLEAHGRSRVSGVTYQRADGKKVKARCQSLVVCLPASPSFELARQGGAKVGFDERHGTFVVESDERGRTAAEVVFVAGTQRGALPVDAASAHGREVARAIQEGLS